jgi:ABC-type uncharacterized transport system, permease component
MLDFLPYLLTALIYVVVAALYWRRTEIATPWAQAAVSVALAIHGWLLYHSLFVAEGMNMGLTNALSAIFWLTALIYWGTNLRHDLHRCRPSCCRLRPCSCCCNGRFRKAACSPTPASRCSGCTSPSPSPPTACSLFAALHALLMAAAERALHRKPSLLKLPDFPPLIGMENLLFQIIAVGFVLLTLTLVSGVMFSEQLFHQAFRFNHKTVFTMISWLIFGALLGGRWKYGWRGRKAIRWTLSGFGVLLLAYVGSKFVLEFILKR